MTTAMSSYIEYNPEYKVFYLQYEEYTYKGETTRQQKPWWNNGYGYNLFYCTDMSVCQVQDLTNRWVLWKVCISIDHSQSQTMEY